MSASFIDSVDIQNGIYEENALRMIEQWEKTGDSILLGDQKRLLLQRSEDTQAGGEEQSDDPSHRGIVRQRDSAAENYRKLFN